MRLVPLVFLCGCGQSDRAPAPPPVPMAAPKLAEPARPDHAVAARLHCSGAPVAPAKFAGDWVGTRPFDNANPLLHRGPTVVHVGATGRTLHLDEGIGAVAYSIGLDLDAARSLAFGHSRETKTTNVLALGGRTTKLEITRELSVAVCLDGDTLQLSRIMDTSGAGIQTIHDDDVVVLQRKPPAPAAPPPPPGFTVLAEGQTKGSLALAPGEVVWSTIEGQPVHSAIRAVKREGGPVRELASGLEFIHALAVRGDYVYFAEQTRIARVPLAGGAVEPLVEASADGLAVTSTALVWKGFDDAVYTAPIAGGTPKQLVKSADRVMISSLAVADGFAYITTTPMAKGADGTYVPGKLLRVSLAGGGASAIAAGDFCGPVAVDRGAVWWSTCDAKLVRGGTAVAREQDGIESIAFGGGAVVFALGERRGEIRAFAGGKVKTLVQGDFDPQAVAVDPNDPKVAYVLDRGDTMDVPHGRIGKIAL